MAIQFKGNGTTVKLKWTAIILTGLVLIFGTNIFGGYIQSRYAAEEATRDIREIKIELTKTDGVLDSFNDTLAEHDTKIAVLETKLENLKTGQAEIKQLIIQGR